MNGIGDFRNNPEALAKGVLNMKRNAVDRRKPILTWVSYLLNRASRSNYDISCEEIALVLNNKQIKTVRGLDWNTGRVQRFINTAIKEGEL